MTFAGALRDEIRRLARQEIRSQTSTTVHAVSRYRHEIAKLKREVRDQAKKIAFLEVQEGKRMGEKSAAEDVTEGTRFSARSVKAQREKTGLSAADFGKLVGVSALTIYNWEQGKFRPRKEQLASLVALRGLGKREAQVKLKLLDKNGASAPGNGRRKK